MSRHAKSPNLARATVGVFRPPTSKFVFAHLARMVCSEDIRVYTGSGETSLRPVCYYSCYWHLVCIRGYKQAREGKDPKSLMKGVNGCGELDRPSAVCSCCALVFLSRGSVLCGSGSPFMGRPASPFIGQGKARVIADEKEKKEREEGL